MVNEFQQQWTLILGGSSGLGLATAQKLAAHGMNLCIVHRNARVELERIEQDFDTMRARGVQVLSYNADALSKEKQDEIISELVSKIGTGKIYGMVHSIAKGSLKSMTGEDGLSTEDFQITLQAMAVSLHEWTRAVFQAGLFAPQARILSFTSEGGRKPLPYYGAVSAAKATLEAISRQIALEYAPYGITSNCIQAGVTETPALKMIPNSDKIMEVARSRNPNKRLTTPEDVANVTYLLLKKEASWINGTLIVADGGESL